MLSSSGHSTGPLVPYALYIRLQPPPPPPPLPFNPPLCPPFRLSLHPFAIHSRFETLPDQDDTASQPFLVSINTSSSIQQSNQTSSTLPISSFSATCLQLFHCPWRNVSSDKSKYNPCRNFTLLHCFYVEFFFYL